MGKLAVAALISGLTLVSGPAFSQETGTEQAVDPAALAADIHKEIALNFIHHLNEKERQEAQLASSKAQGEPLRQFATTLTTEHQASEDKLQGLLASEDVNLQNFQLSTFELAFLNRLGALPAAQFDVTFARFAEQEHATAVQELERLRTLVQDPEVLAFIAETIPAIQAHQQQAAALASGQQPGQAGGDAPGTVPGQDDPGGADDPTE